VAGRLARTPRAALQAASVIASVIERRTNGMAPRRPASRGIGRLRGAISRCAARILSERSKRASVLRAHDASGRSTRAAVLRASRRHGRPKPADATGARSAPPCFALGDPGRSARDRRCERRIALAGASARSAQASVTPPLSAWHGVALARSVPARAARRTDRVHARRCSSLTRRTVYPCIPVAARRARGCTAAIVRSGSSTGRATYPSAAMFEPWAAGRRAQPPRSEFAGYWI